MPLPPAPDTTNATRILQDLADMRASLKAQEYNLKELQSAMDGTRATIAYAEETLREELLKLGREQLAREPHREDRADGVSACIAPAMRVQVAPTPEAPTLELELVAPDHNLPNTEVPAPATFLPIDQLRSALRNYLREHVGLVTVREVADSLGENAGRVRKQLKWLVSQDEVLEIQRLTDGLMVFQKRS